MARQLRCAGLVSIELNSLIFELFISGSLRNTHHSGLDLAKAEGDTTTRSRSSAKGSKVAFLSLPGPIESTIDPPQGDDELFLQMQMQHVTGMETLTSV